MWKGRVLEEIYKIGEDSAKSFDRDLKEICDDLSERHLNSRIVISTPFKSHNLPKKTSAD